MSRISQCCKNNGKHEGTGAYWVCERCRNGLINGCGYYEPKKSKKGKDDE